MLDVDGNAFLFEDRYHRCVGLIDGGDVSTQEAFLKHLKLSGYQRFDIVIVTHDDRDHTAGIEALLKDPYFKVDRLITEINAPDGLTLEVCGGLYLVFYPPLDAPRKNDRSLVTGLIFDAFTVLSTGDVERLGEAQLITFPQRDYLFLTLPHHGSITSSSEGLLDFVKPQYALASLPHRNVHGFPHDDVKARLAQRNIHLKTTEEGGTWVIRGTKNRYVIHP
jgi:competence protein ComEC